MKFRALRRHGHALAATASITASAVLTALHVGDANARPQHATWCTTHRCAHRAAAPIRRARRHRRHLLRVIHPYRWWLRSTGACESGGGYSLRSGLRAVSPGGTYRGRYQFDWSSWRGAGGHGDPVRAGWLEQAFRAVKWRRIAGTGAWPRCGA